MRHAAIAVLLVTLGPRADAGSLRISSPDINAGLLPRSATCEGEGRSPDLQLSGVPPAAKSLVLIVVDPDVPKALVADGRFLHWVLWDLPIDTVTLVDGQRGRGLKANGGGRYIPACPPNGEHRYIFQLFALDTVIGDARIASEADLRRAMEGHVLDQAELVSRYTTRTFRIIRIVVVVVGLLLVIFVVRRFVARRTSNREPRTLG